MNALCIKYTSRKFVLCLGCGFVTSLLTFLGKIDGNIYMLVILGTVGAYITENHLSKAKKDPDQ